MGGPGLGWSVLFDSDGFIAGCGVAGMYQKGKKKKRTLKIVEENASDQEWDENRSPVNSAIRNERILNYELGKIKRVSVR